MLKLLISIDTSTKRTNNITSSDDLIPLPSPSSFSSFFPTFFFFFPFFKSSYHS